jgi:dimethylhistidine N-methyltransferase
VTAVQRHGLEPELERLRDDVVAGLRRRPRTLPCKYFYDARGSRLFERICELDEYYPTRTELAILERSVAEMARCLGPDCMVIEPGSGSGTKTRLLLEALERPVAWVPVDISRDVLLRSSASIDGAHPELEVLPVWADFTEPFALPATKRPCARRVVYFPGSTIGNFDPPDVVRFLARLRRLTAPGGALLVGADLRKDRKVLEAAYDDAAGVTAEFNLNLLLRVNRELGADFDLARFRHRALWDEQRGRVEMHLVSTAAQTVHLDGESFEFAAGEAIHSESSYKYDLPGFAGLARAAGLDVARVWLDEQRWFSVQYLTEA